MAAAAAGAIDPRRRGKKSIILELFWVVPSVPPSTHTHIREGLASIRQSFFLFPSSSALGRGEADSDADAAGASVTLMEEKEEKKKERGRREREGESEVRGEAEREEGSAMQKCRGRGKGDEATTDEIVCVHPPPPPNRRWGTVYMEEKEEEQAVSQCHPRDVGQYQLKEEFGAWLHVQDLFLSVVSVYRYLLYVR